MLEYLCQDMMFMYFSFSLSLFFVGAHNEDRPFLLSIAVLSCSFP